MKQIKTIASGIVTVGTDWTNISQAWDILSEARKNRQKVIDAACTVEGHLEDTILHFFMGEKHERKAVFKSLVLNSDWCSFAAKRKLLRHIIEDQKLLEGVEKNDFEELMKQTMSARNAFAHGNFKYVPPSVLLCYFEGSPQQRELTDDYLTKLESTLFKAHEVALNLTVKIGATKWQGKAPIPDFDKCSIARAPESE